MMEIDRKIEKIPRSWRVWPQKMITGLSFIMLSHAAFAQDLHSGYVWDHPACLRYQSPQPNLLIFGDSIFDGWSGYLMHEFPRAMVDAKVSRQFSSAIGDYKKLMEYRGVRRIRSVVIELGTNGRIHKSDIEAFVK